MATSVPLAREAPSQYESLLSAGGSVRINILLNQLVLVLIDLFMAIKRKDANGNLMTPPD
jgi:hypothetical protein